MNVTHLTHDDRPGDGRPTRQLVGREAELDRIDAFLATARTDGGALLETGECRQDGAPGRRVDGVGDGPAHLLFLRHSWSVGRRLAAAGESYGEGG
jgi:hypothetical protein